LGLRRLSESDTRGINLDGCGVDAEIDCPQFAHTAGVRAHIVWRSRKGLSSVTIAISRSGIRPGNTCPFRRSRWPVGGFSALQAPQMPRKCETCNFWRYRQQRNT